MFDEETIFFCCFNEVKVGALNPTENKRDKEYLKLR